MRKLFVSFVLALCLFFTFIPGTFAHTVLVASPTHVLSIRASSFPSTSTVPEPTVCQWLGSNRYPGNRTVNYLAQADCVYTYYYVQAVNSLFISNNGGKTFSFWDSAVGSCYDCAKTYLDSKTYYGTAGQVVYSHWYITVCTGYNDCFNVYDTNSYEHTL